MKQKQAIALSILAVTVAPVATAQDGPRTAWGAPNLQGVWDFRSITPMQRPRRYGDREFLTREEAATREQDAVDRDRQSLRAVPRLVWMDRVTDTVETRRTSLIVDPPNGRMPARTEVARARAPQQRAYRTRQRADSWLDRSIFERCILGLNTGPPMTPRAYNQNMQVFQTEDTVVILNEMVHESRIIPIDGTPRTGIASWTGESRGRWENDTLVVETKNFTDKSRWRGSTENMTLVERFSRQDGDTLIYTFTVTDPDTWVQPWTAEIPMRRSEQPLYEYACHEGNYAMAGILAGARADERAEEQE